MEITLILGTTSPLALGLAILGSQIPDIDTITSTIGLHSNGCKIFFPVQLAHGLRISLRHDFVTFSPSFDYSFSAGY
ncbi:MAG: hypothetical protein WBM86_20645, partial [Waterburya sp.]